MFTQQAFAFNEAMLMPTATVLSGLMGPIVDGITESGTRSKPMQNPECPRQNWHGKTNLRPVCIPTSSSYY
ncbi:hypothetical protein WJX82_003822 [Trebouxia sp. C0006]